MKWKSWWLLLLLMVSTGQTLAQDDCPAIVAAALETAVEACTDVARNQACYGNVLLEVEPQPDAESFTFEQAGDIADLSNIASLQLSPMDTETATWGVALLRVQGNAPGMYPIRNVRMALFGQVEMTSVVPIETEVAPEPTPVRLDVEVSVTNSINVRRGPSTNGAIVAALDSGSTVTADGRNDDSTWLHVLLPDGGAGWVFAELVTVNGDINQLPVTVGNAPVPGQAVQSPPTYGPMQAFYFRSGIGDAPCAEAPESGILTQSRQGDGQIVLLANEVELHPGSTTYLQAQPGGEMTVNVIEGQGSVTAFGVTVIVTAGTRARIPLDENGLAAGAPLGPEPYDATAFAALPLSLLPRQVAVAAPLTEEMITALSTGSGLLLGEWTLTVVLRYCAENADPFTIPVEYTGRGWLDRSVSDEQFRHLAAQVVLSAMNQWNLATTEFAIPGNYSYTGIGAASDDLTIAFTISSRTSIEGVANPDRIRNCSRISFTLEAAN